jgi:hypothetical protein
LSHDYSKCAFAISLSRFLRQSFEVLARDVLLLDPTTIPKIEEVKHRISSITNPEERRRVVMFDLTSVEFIFCDFSVKSSRNAKAPKEGYDGILKFGTLMFYFLCVFPHQSSCWKE